MAAHNIWSIMQNKLGEVIKYDTTLTLLATYISLSHQSHDDHEAFHSCTAMN